MILFLIIIVLVALFAYLILKLDELFVLSIVDYMLLAIGFIVIVVVVCLAAMFISPIVIM